MDPEDLGPVPLVPVLKGRSIAGASKLAKAECLLLFLELIWKLITLMKFKYTRKVK